MSDPSHTDLTTQPDCLPVIQEGPAALMSAIMQFATNPAMDIDKFDRLIALQERTEDRQAERAFNAAFVRLQGKLPRVKRDGSLEYPVDKNKPDGPKRVIANFARWETIDAAIRPALTEEGFGLSFKILPRPNDGGGLNVCAVLRHVDGYKEIGDPMPVPLDTSGGKNNLQAYGSSLSYGKKYAAFAALNIITEGEDDDGVRGGMKFISEEQIAELRTLFKDAGREEFALLQKMTQGEVRSAEELQQQSYTMVKNTLGLIIAQNAKTGAV
jgi:hypothetical protein